MQAGPEIQEAVSLLEKVREGALATLEENKPFVSAVGFIYVKDRGISATPQLSLGGGIYILLSDLARHTRHLKKNPEASLLVVENNSSVPIYEKKRFTILGQVEQVKDGKEAGELKSEYLTAFPKSDIFFTLPDFHFYRLEPREIYWIGGFGKIKTLK